MASACCVWDFTIPNMNNKREKIMELLESTCKKWCFQLEKGDQTGHLHFQGRLSLKVRARETSVRKMFKDFNGVHISLTSTENSKNMFYVTKAETREAGPWQNKEEGDETNYIRYKFQEPLKPYAWQQKIIDMISETPDSRAVNILYDPRGNIGKSYLFGWLDDHGMITDIPAMDNYQDVLACVIAKLKAARKRALDDPKCYVIDVPRQMSRTDLGGFWSALERMKAGYVFDKRNNWKEAKMNDVHIWVVLNQIPDMRNLSMDRFHVWMVVGTGPEAELKRGEVHFPPREVTAVIPRAYAIPARVEGKYIYQDTLMSVGDNTVDPTTM